MVLAYPQRQRCCISCQPHPLTDGVQGASRGPRRTTGAAPPAPVPAPARAAAAGAAPVVAAAPPPAPSPPSPPAPGWRTRMASKKALISVSVTGRPPAAAAAAAVPAPPPPPGVVVAAAAVARGGGEVDLAVEGIGRGGIMGRGAAAAARGGTRGVAAAAGAGPSCSAAWRSRHSFTWRCSSDAETTASQTGQVGMALLV